MNLEDSEDDFLPQRGTAAGRLNRAISRARRSLQSESTSLASELGSRFPFARSQPSSTSRQSASRRKLSTWKVVPCLLSGPSIVSVPKKGVLDTLCKCGLGTLWFTKEDPLSIATYLIPEELHFLFLCLYPILSGISYEMCKAAGPGNSVIVALDIDDPRKKPEADHEFFPFFAPDRLKTAIGRKGRIYIRPLKEIELENITKMPEYLV